MCLRVEKVCPSQAQTHQTHMKTHFVVALLVALLMLRKTGKPLQEWGVCVVRIAENPLLIVGEERSLWATTTQRERDGRRKTTRGCKGRSPCPSESGELS